MALRRSTKLESILPSQLQDFFFFMMVQLQDFLKLILLWY